MDFEFSEEQEQLRESVRRFLEENAPLSYVREMFDDERGSSRAVWDGLTELGLTGLLVHEQFGGADLGMLEMGVVLEELGRLVHPGPFAASAVGATVLLRAAGSLDETAALHSDLAAGRRVGTVALFEPGRRYAWREPGAVAVPVGDDWELTGEEAHVLDALAADFYLVVARVEAEGGGLGVFAVDRSASGLAVAMQGGLDGTRKRGRVSLAGTRGQRLAVSGAAAMGAVSEAVDCMAIALCADGVGAAERALEMSVAYAAERVQFGKPIGSFQAVQHLLADMLQALELGRAATYYALWAADAADDHERHRAASLAQAWVSETFPKIGAEAIQVFGGVGFTWEYDIHLYFKRLLSLQSDFGGEAEHLEELARLILD